MICQVHSWSFWVFHAANGPDCFCLPSELQETHHFTMPECILGPFQYKTLMLIDWIITDHVQIVVKWLPVPHFSPKPQAWSYPWWHHVRPCRSAGSWSQHSWDMVAAELITLRFQLSWLTYLLPCNITGILFSILELSWTVLIWRKNLCKSHSSAVQWDRCHFTVCINENTFAVACNAISGVQMLVCNVFIRLNTSNV